jgi:hypothetical protein
VRFTHSPLRADLDFICSTYCNVHYPSSLSSTPEKKYLDVI